MKNVTPSSLMPTVHRLSMPLLYRTCKQITFMVAETTLVPDEAIVGVVMVIVVAGEEDATAREEIVGYYNDDGPNLESSGNTSTFDNQQPRQGAWVWAYTPQFNTRLNSHGLLPSHNDHQLHASGPRSKPAYHTINPLIFLNTQLLNKRLI